MDPIVVLLDLLKLCGGLGFFLYGMHVLSDGLEKLAGGKMQSVLEKITNNRFKGLLVGTVVTAVIQSSSATTVMLVGLVNSGLMTLTQSIGVIFGANIGTTITAWLMSLNSIDGNAAAGTEWMKFLKPENFCMVIALICAFTLMMTKKEKNRNIGIIGLGFSVLMYGMKMMSDGMSNFSEQPWFSEAMTVFNNPLMGVLIGTVFTALVQSSSASVGVLQAITLAPGSTLTYGGAIPIVLGQNIGTCISALMACPGTSKNAKRVAVTHTLIKIIGVALWLALWMLAGWLFDLSPITDAKIDPVGIAVCHTVFNILNTAALIPFVNWLEKLANLVVRGDDKDAMPEVFLDERLFTVPAVAAAKAYDITGEMALTTKDTVAMAFGLFDRYDEVIASEVTRKEKTLDMYEDKLGSYLVSLSRCDLNENDARTSAMLLHTISDFERIGDHANNLVHTAAEMREKKLAFSEDAAAELRVLTDAVQTILAESITAFTKNDMELASEIEPLEQVIDDLIDTIRARHITRLQSGNCTIELGFILTDFLTDCERISDHCSNVGVAILETAHGTFDTHERLRAIKSRSNENFRQSFEKYQRQFVLQA